MEQEQVYRSKDKFNFGKWDKIEWIKNHPDPNMRWIYETARKNPCGPDFSDAGLAYYLVADLDNKRGDEMGNDIKLRKWMGDDIISNVNTKTNLNIDMAGGIVVGEDYIVIEAEATKSNLGNWVVRDQKDPLYSTIPGHPKPIGGKYLEYMGGTIMGRPKAEIEKDVLEYKFTPMTSGNYTFTGRMAQRLTLNGKVEREDLCNDIYVKMEGDFESANKTPKDVLTSWNKFYGRGVDKWGGLSRADANHKHLVYSYALKAGKEYTFKISGRSMRCNLDYIIFVKSPYKYGNHVDIAANNPIKYRAGLENIGSEQFTLTIPSVSFDKFTKMGEGYANASIDKGHTVLQMATRLGVGAAEYTYNGPDREVSIMLNTMLEADGESQYTVFINGNKVDRVTNKRIFGKKIKDYTVTSHKIGKKTNISKGDIIRVEFTSATNGLVPEGSTTATSRGRWTSIVLTTK